MKKGTKNAENTTAHGIRARSPTALLTMPTGTELRGSDGARRFNQGMTVA